MAVLLVLVFLIGYVGIALEQAIKIDKAAVAILTGVLCWIILIFGMAYMPVYSELTASYTEISTFTRQHLSTHLSGISEILFFLLGAMIIVELVDAHNGFQIITNRITTTNLVKLIWVTSWITFFLSAILDNMTTAIIMCALLRQIIRSREKLWLLGGFVILAANAGGAWSPIGDVTTIMLWIGGQVTTFNIITSTFLASFASLLIPLLLLTLIIQKKEPVDDTGGLQNESEKSKTSPLEQNALFALGCLGLLTVPVFKSVTQLPPYMGILFSLGFIWVVTEIMHRSKEHEHRKGLMVAYILQKVDTTSILFFLGILLAVAALDTSGHLTMLAEILNEHAGNIYLINTMIGLVSAVVDNVPLVAACIGMYDLTTYPPDHDFWELLAYCAGTGGSLLIIGSAAGVAAMGILRIDFLWYLRRISLYAAIGYFSGIAVYYLQHHH